MVLTYKINTINLACILLIDKANNKHLILI